MMPGYWRDLADSELRAKLEQRGVLCIVAAALVRRREDPTAAEHIDRILGNR